MKTVYTCFCTDVIHEGHLNLIREAQKLLSDKAVIRYNRFFTISFEERMDLVRSIEGVSRVVEQKSIRYDDIICELHPDYIVHGDNWKTGPLKFIRDGVEKLVQAYGGQLVDIPYTYN